MASCSIPPKKRKIESTTNPNWLQLPRDITSNILQRLGAFEILTSVRNVCPYWWNICKEPRMWRTIRMSDIPMLRYESFQLSKICRFAVDLSCGHLEEIYIKYFGTDDLLEYIADRASKLRRLRIEQCHRSMSDEGLIEAVKKLPLLEELDVSNCRLLHTVSFNVIGKCCPLLKSLNLDGFFSESDASDHLAFGIAETMAGLTHLKIMNNSLTNDGLLAILDRCSMLESLDLRGSFNLDLSGSLGKRCKNQIKVLRLPNDFIENSDHIPEDPELLGLLVCWTGSVAFHGCNFSFLDNEIEDLCFDDEDYY